MIQLASGILGAAAATLAFGAVHLEVATGNDLLGPRHLVSAKTSNLIAGTPDIVDRSGKGDRQNVSMTRDTARDLTIGFRVPGSSDSSVLMRMPLREVAKNVTTPGGQSASVPRRVVACEPSVSVLTPIARQLGPARCVT